MKEIVIVSGKGGVGKSTITASFGVLFSKKYKVVLADTDVDAPNLALFFDVAEKNSYDISTSEKAYIAYGKCTGCLRCVEVCRFSSMVALHKKPVVIAYTCEGCGACMVVCPEKAIEIKRVENGRITVYGTDHIIIVSGALHIGESNSGGIVDEVKKIAKQEAKKLNVDFIITDGPPGIGCPVISSVKGSDYVIAVTEPTPAALRDLKRLIAVVKNFRIPAGIVINKSEIDQKSGREIKGFAEKNEITVISAIPYDLRIPEAIAKAMPVVDAYPDAPSSQAIRRLVDTVWTLVQSGAIEPAVAKKDKKG
ncbi:MAG: P-loop NTPase [Candidatus Kuenenia sp.]|nr:P-loop NTPase [Candidatus Kuenenia hertensis]